MNVRNCTGSADVTPDRVSSQPSCILCTYPLTPVSQSDTWSCLAWLRCRRAGSPLQRLWMNWRLGSALIPKACQSSLMGRGLGRGIAQSSEKNVQARQTEIELVLQGSELATGYLGSTLVQQEMQQTGCCCAPVACIKLCLVGWVFIFYYAFVESVLAGAEVERSRLVGDWCELGRSY